MAFALQRHVETVLSFVQKLDIGGNGMSRANSEAGVRDNRSSGNGGGSGSGSGILKPVEGFASQASNNYRQEQAGPCTQ